MRHADHLQRLEAESIHIFREVAGECDRPVLLYSIGKDSAVLLHLAQKAFYPGELPFPLLHIDRLSNETVAIGLVDTPVVVAEPAPRSGERWPPLNGEASWRRLAKAFSWRAVGSIGTMTLAFALTHDKGLAAVIGAGEILTKIVIYYLHERLWARVPFGIGR